MKALLVCEYRQGKLLESTYELLAFADLLAAEKVMLLVGSEAAASKLRRQGLPGGCRGLWRI